jgi:hypothetical protein
MVGEKFMVPLDAQATSPTIYPRKNPHRTNDLSPPFARCSVHRRPGQLQWSPFFADDRFYD